MMCAKYSALLYSFYNIELAYSLKRICRELNINLLNVGKFTDLVYLTSEDLYNIIFVDCSTVPKNDVFIDFLQGFRHLNNTILIFIDGKDLPEHERFYTVSSSNLQADILDVKSKVELKCCSDFSELDMGEVGDKVSEFLISVGLTTKYMGFAYIKQVVLYGMIEGGLYCSLSRELYPMIAIRNHTNVANVERNIRSAITVATGTEKYIKNVKPYLGDKPANRTFLNYLVDKAVMNLKDTAIE